jgi:hypothetical protein
MHRIIVERQIVATVPGKTAEARLADTAELLKGDIAEGEIAQAERDERPILFPCRSPRTNKAHRAARQARK